MTDRDRPAPEPAATLRTDDRAVAEQIDFLNGMILLLLGVGMFLSVSGVVLDIAQRSGSGSATASLRSADLLADDVLRGGDPTADSLNQSCTDAYFERNKPGDCGFDDFDDTDRNTWVRTSLGIGPEYEANVTLREPDGSAYDAIGPDPPTERGTVDSYHRRVTFNNTNPTYRTLVVRIWSA